CKRESQRRSCPNRSVEAMPPRLAQSEGGRPKKCLSEAGRSLRLIRNRSNVHLDCKARRKLAIHLPREPPRMNPSGPRSINRLTCYTEPMFRGSLRALAVAAWATLACGTFVMTSFSLAVSTDWGAHKVPDLLLKSRLLDGRVVEYVRNAINNDWLV